MVISVMGGFHAQVRSMKVNRKHLPEGSLPTTTQLPIVGGRVSHVFRFLASFSLKTTKW